MPGVASRDLVVFLRRITDRIVFNLRVPPLLVFALSDGGWRTTVTLIVLARAAPLPLPLRL